jgi:hypothetical protein
VYLIVTRVYVFDHSSVLYAGLYDGGLGEILDSGIGDQRLPAILPIDSPCGRGTYTGPEDPRIFVSPDGRLTHVLFNMLNASTQRSIYMYTMETGGITEFVRPGSGGPQDTHTEKNWVPFGVVVPGARRVPAKARYHFVANQAGPLVYACDPDSGRCETVQGDGRAPVSPLKGGSPLVPLPGAPPGYHLGLTYLHTEDHQYRPLVSVFRASAQPRVGGLRSIYHGGLSWGRVLSGAGLGEDARVQIATGIGRVSGPTLDLFVTINDVSIVVLEAEGLLEFLRREVVAKDLAGTLDPGAGDIGLAITSMRRGALLLGA